MHFAKLATHLDATQPQRLDHTLRLPAPLDTPAYRSWARHSVALSIGRAPQRVTSPLAILLGPFYDLFGQMSAQLCW